MKLARLWKAFFAAWLAGCAGRTPVVRNELERPPAVVTGEEACHARSALVLLCGERSCAFYRCGEVALREAAPTESAPPDAAPYGEVVLVRGPAGGLGPPGVGAPLRWWDPTGGVRSTAEPVFVISWRPPPRPPLPPGLQVAAEQIARRPHVQHHLFPPEEEFREWFLSKGIDPEAWTGMTIANCSVTVVEVRPDGGLRLVSFDEARDEFTRSYLSQILQITGGNVSQAARLAKRNRTDFYKLLGRHQLVPDDFKTR